MNLFTNLSKLHRLTSFQKLLLWEHLTQKLLLSGADCVKNNHNNLCDKELKFGIVVEEAMKSKTGYRAKYVDYDYVSDPGEIWWVSL